MFSDIGLIVEFFSNLSFTKFVSSYFGIISFQALWGFMQFCRRTFSQIQGILEKLYVNYLGV